MALCKHLIRLQLGQVVDVFTDRGDAVAVRSVPEITRERAKALTLSISLSLAVAMFEQSDIHRYRHPKEWLQCPVLHA